MHFALLEKHVETFTGVFQWYSWSVKHISKSILRLQSFDNFTAVWCFKVILWCSAPLGARSSNASKPPCDEWSLSSFVTIPVEILVSFTGQMIEAMEGEDTEPMLRQQILKTLNHSLERPCCLRRRFRSQSVFYCLLVFQWDVWGSTWIGLVSQFGRDLVSERNISCISMLLPLLLLLLLVCFAGQGTFGGCRSKQMETPGTLVNRPTGKHTANCWDTLTNKSARILVTNLWESIADCWHSVFSIICTVLDVVPWTSWFSHTCLILFSCVHRMGACWQSWSQSLSMPLSLRLVVSTGSHHTHGARAVAKARASWC